jgi:hypothetical protein
MSSDHARVIARAVGPEDRASWEKLFRDYRDFYNLSYDASVCLSLFVRAHSLKHLSDFSQPV